MNDYNAYIEAQKRAALNAVAEDAKLTRMLPNWRKIAQSDGFKKWLNESPGAEASFYANTAFNRAKILNDYSRSIEEQKQADLVVNKLTILAEQGDASAQFNLGVKYRNGDGVPKDAAKAVEWSQKAAAQGLPRAQGMLGVMYFKGEGVSKDIVLAYAWFSLAAAKGSDGEKDLRDSLEEILTESQRAEGRQMVSNWKMGGILVREDPQGFGTVHR